LILLINEAVCVIAVLIFGGNYVFFVEGEEDKLGVFTYRG
jgi:hypothetical protein